MIKKSLTDCDPRLADELREMLAPSYEDADPVLRRELVNNTDIYLAIDEVGRLSAFFMVGWHRPDCVAGNSCLYLGLSACREDLKGYGLTLRLYRQVVQDAVAWEAAHGKRLLLWATTAHPIVFSCFYRFATPLPGASDGNCPVELADLAWDLRKHLPKHYQTSDHPLVMRGVAADTLYSAVEVVRVAAARLKLEHDLFSSWEIDERRGDRLLLLGRVPLADGTET